MKKWENPELMILGVENTKTDFFGSDNSNGNDNGRPDDCFCSSINGHDHGAWADKGKCACCDRTDTKPSLS